MLPISALFIFGFTCCDKTNGLCGDFTCDNAADCEDFIELCSFARIGDYVNCADLFNDGHIDGRDLGVFTRPNLSMCQKLRQGIYYWLLLTTQVLFWPLENVKSFVLSFSFSFPSLPSEAGGGPKLKKPGIRNSEFFLLYWMTAENVDSRKCSETQKKKGERWWNTCC